MTAPSGWTINNVMGIASSVQARLEADGIDTDEAELLATLREEGADVDTILLRLVRAADEAGTMGDAVGERIDALNARRSRYYRVRQECRAAVLSIMDALDLEKWTNAEYSASFKAGQPGVVITDEAAVPDNYVRISRTVDKTAVAQSLHAGHDVPGAVLQNGLPVLTIRTK